MMKRIASIFVIACGLALLPAAGAQPSLHFPLHQFTIAPLEAANNGKNSLLLTMSLPPAGDFSANVNVMLQQGHGSIDDYIATSKRGIQQAGLRLLKSQKTGADTAVLEYAGQMNNRPLHFYAKATLKGDEVLLATATATEHEWLTVESQLQSCVDSLKRD